jgi:DNA processing protein
MSLPGNWSIEDILTLSYVKKVNLEQFRTTIESFDSLEELLSLESKQSISARFNQISFEKNEIENFKSEALKQLELCDKNQVDVITLWDDYYPLMLKNIFRPPVILFVKGTLQPADSISISIVGTRRNSSYGRMMAENFSSEFARAGIIITSGLADGIDTISHLSALKSVGITYAVLASGLDKISPSLSYSNSKKILEGGGALISEYRCGTTALIPYFPQRNRIISGISRATLVIESDEKGGSLITAKFALDESRDLFAMPGNINSDRSRGTNMLIKLGSAIPALSPESVLKDMGLFKEKGTLLGEKAVPYFQNETEEKIFSILSNEPMQIDEIAAKAELEMTDILVRLLDMEFRSLVRQLPGKHYIKEFKNY